MKKILISDPNKCTGCRVCESVCSLSHHSECNPRKSRIRVFRWDLRGIDIPVVCLFCEEAICIASCVMNALSKDPVTGAVITNERRCVGCGMCFLMCPFGGASLTVDRKVLRCDLCQGDPSCAKLCQTKGLQYVRTDQLGMSKMRESIESVKKIQEMLRVGFSGTLSSK
jgi:Fe-S-cluster-containing hydrogenase component 2